jgi:predicted phage terminase large subunit-like protein
MRNLMDSMEYKDLFPKVTLRADNKSAGRWETEEGGEYFAVGTGGAVTGRGADLLIIDDVHSEQDALSPGALEQAYDWYLSGPRQRLQPGGAIVIVMTRWSTKDLTGRLLSKQTGEYSDKWEVVEFPAIFPETGNPLWGEFWKKEELLAVKESLSVAHWNAQWMQQPTSEEGAIIKREWWRSWEGETIPPVEYIIQSYDTAFLKKESADYSAITTWGVFYPNEDEGASLILMDAKRGRWEFPELKKIAAKEYRYWDPEMVIIEAKASGLPLTHELRQIGIPVVNFSPSRGNDKHARVNAVAPMFESGQVWAPVHFKFSEEVIEECAAFPFGDHDDFVDSTTQALLRFRQGGYLPLPSDYKEDEFPPQARTYY